MVGIATGYSAASGKSHRRREASHYPAAPIEFGVEAVLLMAFFALLTYVFLWDVYRRGRDYILSGVGVGLGAATKYQPVILLISVLLAHVFRFAQRDGRLARGAPGLAVADGGRRRGARRLRPHLPVEQRRLVEEVGVEVAPTYADDAVHNRGLVPVVVVGEAEVEACQAQRERQDCDCDSARRPAIDAPAPARCRFRDLRIWRRLPTAPHSDNGQVAWLSCRSMSLKAAGVRLPGQWAPPECVGTWPVLSGHPNGSHE
jgi:hypothetical protein